MAQQVVPEQFEEGVAVAAGACPAHLRAQQGEPLIQRIERPVAVSRFADAVGVEESCALGLKGREQAAPESSPSVSRPSGGAGAGTSRTATPSSAIRMGGGWPQE